MESASSNALLERKGWQQGQEMKAGTARACLPSQGLGLSLGNTSLPRDSAGCPGRASWEIEGDGEGQSQSQGADGGRLEASMCAARSGRSRPTLPADMAPQNTLFSYIVGFWVYARPASLAPGKPSSPSETRGISEGLATGQPSPLWQTQGARRWKWSLVDEPATFSKGRMCAHHCRLATPGKQRKEPGTRAGLCLLLLSLLYQLLEHID